MTVYPKRGVRPVVASGTAMVAKFAYHYDPQPEPAVKAAAAQTDSDYVETASNAADVDGQHVDGALIAKPRARFERGLSTFQLLPSNWLV
jgi:hypothetical protein